MTVGLPLPELFAPRRERFRRRGATASDNPPGAWLQCVQVAAPLRVLQNAKCGASAALFAKPSDGGVSLASPDIRSKSTFLNARADVPLTRFAAK